MGRTSSKRAFEWVPSKSLGDAAVELVPAGATCGAGGHLPETVRAGRGNYFTSPSPFAASSVPVLEVVPTGTVTVPAFPGLPYWSKVIWVWVPNFAVRPVRK